MARATTPALSPSTYPATMKYVREMANPGISRKAKTHLTPYHVRTPAECPVRRSTLTGWFTHTRADELSSFSFYEQQHHTFVLRLYEYGALFHFYFATPACLPTGATFGHHACLTASHLTHRQPTCVACSRLLCSLSEPQGVGALGTERCTLVSYDILLRVAGLVLSLTPVAF